MNKDQMPRNVQYSANMWGLELRYLLWQFINTSVTPMTTAQLVERCDAEGIEFGGRASKVVSDALRWEVGRGWVERLGRRLYGPGVTPRSTEWWIRERAAKRLHLLRHYLDDTRSPHPMTAVRSTHRYTFLALGVPHSPAAMRLPGGQHVARPSLLRAFTNRRW